MTEKTSAKDTCELPRERDDCPKSYVFRLGSVGVNCSRLVKDLRLLMGPHTAVRLKDRKNAKINDYIASSSIWNVTHLIYLKRTESRIYFNVGRIPHGPKLVFLLKKYTLSSDLSRERMEGISKKIYRTSPLAILHGFSGDEPHIKLALTTFQQLFPSIHPNSTRIDDIRRVVLLSYNKKTKEINLRHYAVKLKDPREVDILSDKLMKGDIPDLSRCRDIGDYILSHLKNTDSGSHVSPAKDGITCPRGRPVSLVEIGPRMSFSLLEVNMELCPKKKSKVKKKKKLAS